ncbi:hypothetical protein acsn021_24030 [Anaerocolumna cellulosilytica]|uniref:Uncharacterized protein n=1 Tax=Anaerocolumna cellulosilytica TaxID=433286 RepID=A0A6S6QW51_9FIRM|nr:hypothetical protein [Anaerocolumna cellulosilytica]MBB5193952.1 hypothetical protein [Anaerocolumna cellulosilytica]BCJ94834.1 hypothetical protein acsn021_24030 [Anaerocolumna cellulosilytica]
MKALVVYPITMHNYSFSAPSCWLFSKNKEKIKGIYSFELNEEYVKEYDFFIVELNWFIQLYEFFLIVDYIKEKNKNASILFGGLYSALKYEEIFKRSDVDYYIQGDNELPIDYLLNDVHIKKIPNLVSRTFRNSVTYKFTEDDFKNLEFNLDWFPSYLKYVSRTSDYYMEDKNYLRLYEYNDQYNLPMIITSKGGCTTRHQGCNNCMGSKHNELYNIYHRPPVKMSNDTLMHLLGKIENNFEKASMLIMSEENYDFTGQFYDIDMSVEIDSNMSTDAMIKVLHAFPKCILNVGIYEEGVSGSTIRKDYKQLLKAEDENHRVNYFVYIKDTNIIDIPENRRLYSEDTFPKWAYWDYYNNFDSALRFSRLFYQKVNKNMRFNCKNK